MLIIPAIDLKDGQCVRLFQGEMTQATVYSDDPGATATRWCSLGAERIHVVDLNGAFAGHRVNAPAIAAIVRASTVPVQLGGGIRTLQDIAATLEEGVATVILGTVACTQPELVKEACRRFPGRIAVGIDARDGKVAVQGWAETTAITALELAQRFEACGVSSIIFTDISRDGAMTGPNLTATAALAAAITTPVIASGGVSCLEDIQRLVAGCGPYPNGNAITGVITGRAIYDGRLDFQAAVAATRGNG